MPHASRLALLLTLLSVAAPARAQWVEVPSPVDYRGLSTSTAGAFKGVLMVNFLNRLHTSTDRGQTWTIQPFNVSALWTDGPEAFALGRALLSDEHRVYRTTDGLTWTSIRAGLPENASFDVLARTTDGTLWTSIFGPFPTVSASTDDGATWALVGGGSYRVLDASGPRVLAQAGLSGPIHYRQSGDTAWTRAATPTSSLVLSLMAEGATVVAVGGFGPPSSLAFEWVQVSTDRGTTWRGATFGAALPTGETPSGGAWVAPSGHLFVQTLARRLLSSTDAGTTWTDAGSAPGESGSPSLFADDAFAYYRNGGSSAFTNRLWRRPLSGFAVAGEGGPEAGSLALAIGPNPARAAATLRFSVAEAQTARVTLTDVLGRDVLRFDRALAAGAHALPLDVSGLAPGVYVARVAAGAASSSVRLTVVR